MTWWESKVTPIFCHAFKTSNALPPSPFPIQYFKNKSCSSAFRPALYNLWLLLVYIIYLSFSLRSADMFPAVEQSVSSDTVSWCYGWNDSLLIEFTHKVTSFLRLWRTRLWMTQTLMTALFILRKWDSGHYQWKPHTHTKVGRLGEFW